VRDAALGVPARNEHGGKHERAPSSDPGADEQRLRLFDQGRVARIGGGEGRGGDDERDEEAEHVERDHGHAAADEQVLSVAAGAREEGGHKKAPHHEGRDEEGAHRDEQLGEGLVADLAAVADAREQGVAAEADDQQRDHCG